MRAVVIGGPGGQLNVLSADHWAGIRTGHTRIVDRKRGRVTILSDRYRSWHPLFTFDPSRASVDAAYRSVFRRFALES